MKKNGCDQSFGTDSVRSASGNACEGDDGTSISKGSANSEVVSHVLNVSSYISISPPAGRLLKLMIWRLGSSRCRASLVRHLQNRTPRACPCSTLQYSLYVLVVSPGEPI